MSEPITRNPIDEQAKRLASEMLKSIGNDVDWRTQQAVTFARIEAKQDHFQFVIDAHWQEIQDLKASAKTVSSSVNGEQLNSRYTLKEMIGGWLALCGAVGMLIGFVGWYLSGAPKP